MSPIEAMVRSILGDTIRNIRPMICAIEVAIEKSFACGKSIEDLQMSRDIHPEVADRLDMKIKAATRQTERLAMVCWEEGDRARLNEIVGWDVQYPMAPKELLIALAAYAFYGVPYREIINRDYAQLV